MSAITSKNSKFERNSRPLTRPKHPSRTSAMCLCKLPSERESGRGEPQQAKQEPTTTTTTTTTTKAASSSDNNEREKPSEREAQGVSFHTPPPLVVRVCVCVCARCTNSTVRCAFAVAPLPTDSRHSLQYENLASCASVWLLLMPPNRFPLCWLT